MTTKADTRPAARSAYLDGTIAVYSQINEVKALLAKHAACAKRFQTDWTFSGDMEHVSALLGQIIGFLDCEYDD